MRQPGMARKKRPGLIYAGCFFVAILAVWMASWVYMGFKVDPTSRAREGEGEGERERESECERASERARGRARARARGRATEREGASEGAHEPWKVGESDRGRERDGKEGEPETDKTESDRPIQRQTDRLCML